MDHTTKSRISVDTIPVALSVYSDGSVDVKVSKELKQKLAESTDKKPLILRAFLKDPAGLLAYRYFLDYVEDTYLDAVLSAHIMYVPNGRQDRENGNDEVTNIFSLKSVARLLDSDCLDKIVITDPHSEVTVECLAAKVTPQYEVYEATVSRFDFEADVIVAPDNGARLKAAEIARRQDRPLALAEKVRDPVTNQITGTKIVEGDVKGKRVVIVDDICDGGRTFKELAKVLKAEGATHVSLYVTHGLFSRYNQELKEDIDQILVYSNWSEEAQADPDFVKTYLAF